MCVAHSQVTYTQSCTWRHPVWQRWITEAAVHAAPPEAKNTVTQNHIVKISCFHHHSASQGFSFRCFQMLQLLKLSHHALILRVKVHLCCVTTAACETSCGARSHRLDQRREETGSRKHADWSNTNSLQSSQSCLKSEPVLSINQSIDQCLQLVSFDSGDAED